MQSEWPRRATLRFQREYVASRLRHTLQLPNQRTKHLFECSAPRRRTAPNKSDLCVGFSANDFGLWIRLNVHLRRHCGQCLEEQRFASALWPHPVRAHCLLHHAWGLIDQENWHWWVDAFLCSANWREAVVHAAECDNKQPEGYSHCVKFWVWITKFGIHLTTFWICKTLYLLQGPSAVRSAAMLFHSYARRATTTRPFRM